MEIKELFNKWSEKSEGDDIKSYLNNSYYSSKVLTEANDFFTERTDKIYEKAESEPDQAFVELLQLALFMNTIITEKAGILDKLGGLVEEFRKILKKIAEKKFSDSYSITAGFPFSFSLGLSWKTDKGD